MIDWFGVSLYFQNKTTIKFVHKLEDDVFLNSPLLKKKPFFLKVKLALAVNYDVTHVSCVNSVLRE